MNDEFDFSDLIETVNEFGRSVESNRRYDEMKSTFENLGLEVSSGWVLTKYKGRGGRVEIPEEVQAIAENAFQSSPLLTEVVVHGDLSSVGNGAFGACRVLQSFEFKGTVAKLGTGVFSGCEMLEKIVLPSNIKAIPNSTFSGCKKLNQVFRYNEVESIGWHAFYNCAKLPAASFGRVKVIDDGAFWGCSALSAFDAGSCLEHLGESSFKNCFSLRNMQLPKTVKTIGKCCFENAGLERVAVPSDVIKIEAGTFAGCVNLRSAMFTDNLLEIGASAFAGCVNLFEAHISEYVVRIHAAAFNDCKSLSISSRNKKYKYAANCVLEVVDNNLIVISSLQESVIVNGFAEIGKYAFSNRKIKFTRLVVPPSVKKIGEKAFANSTIKELIIYSDNIMFEKGAFDSMPMGLCIQCKPKIKSMLTGNSMQLGLSTGCTFKEITE